MAKASTEDSHGDNGEVLINTGTGGAPQISRAVIAAGARAPQSRSVGGAIAALVSWFVITTGTNTVGATGRGAQIAGGAGSVIADGATAVSSNGAGAVNTTGTLAQPWRTASDQLPIPWASRFVINTGTGNINGHRGAQIAGGAGSVIATGAATVSTNGAGAVNTTSTTGALAQFSRTAAGAFSDQMLIQRDFALESGTDRAASASGILINATTGGTINFGTGAQIASAGAVIADGAAAVNTNSAGAVNIYEKRGSNIYRNAVVVGPTCLMIGAGLGIVVCSSKKLDTGVVVAVGFSLKRKVRWWASRLIKKIKDELD